MVARSQDDVRSIFVKKGLHKRFWRFFDSGNVDMKSVIGRDGRPGEMIIRFNYRTPARDDIGGPAHLQELRAEIKSIGRRSLGLLDWD
jgi:hypothetical protein